MVVNKLDFLFGRVADGREKSDILVIFHLGHLPFMSSFILVNFHLFFCINQLALLKHGGMSIILYLVCLLFYIYYHLLCIKCSLAIYITYQQGNQLSGYHESGWIGCGG